MTDDPSPGRVELLDEWDDEQPRRRTPTWWIGPLAVVAVVAIVVAVIIGGTRQPALDPVPSLSVTPAVTTTSSAAQPPSSWTTVDATLPSGATIETAAPAATEDVFTGYTPPPIPADAEAEPLIVTLLSAKPRTASGIVAFDVRICVSPASAGMNGDKVTVARAFWQLGTLETSYTPMASGGLTPEFPEVDSLAAGQCASGLVSFHTSAGSKYIALFYGDNRFGWSWRLQ